MKKTIASAPGKLMLFGEHSVVYGHPCLVTAVDQRLTVSVEENGAEIFTLDAPDMGLVAYSKTVKDLGTKNVPSQVKFVEILYKLFLEKYPQKTSIHVVTKSDFPTDYGFGSSSAVTVAFAKALSAFFQIDLGKQELFDLCYQAVLSVQGVASGFDLAAAIWGGTIYYISPAKVVEKIKINNLPFLVAYTGVKADTTTLIHLVRNLKSENPEKVSKIFRKIDQIVEKAKKALTAGAWDQLGELMNQNQALLRKLQVSSVELERLIKTSLEAGAFGAKLSGAGGGDCLLILASEDKQENISKAVEKKLGKIIPVKLNATGVKLESIL